MRVLAFAKVDSDMGARAPVPIQAVARIDVVSHPALGTGAGRLMSARYEQGSKGARARPFIGERLENAIWSPSPPDVLVGACSNAQDIVPDAIQRGLPWIHVFTAWQRLQPMVPSDLLQVCWNHGEDGLVSNQKQGKLEREAWFVAAALHQLLHYAPPNELIALSREKS